MSKLLASYLSFAVLVFALVFGVRCMVDGYVYTGSAFLGIAAFAIRVSTGSRHGD